MKFYKIIALMGLVLSAPTYGAELEERTSPGVPGPRDIVIHLGEGYRISQPEGWGFAAEGDCGKIMSLGASVNLRERESRLPLHIKDKHKFANLYVSFYIEGVRGLPQELFGVFPGNIFKIIFDSPDTHPVTGGKVIILRNASACVCCQDDHILPTSQLYLKNVSAKSWEILGDHDGAQMATLRESAIARRPIVFKAFQEGEAQYQLSRAEYLRLKEEKLKAQESGRVLTCEEADSYKEISKQYGAYKRSMAQLQKELDICDSFSPEPLGAGVE